MTTQTQTKECFMCDKEVSRLYKEQCWACYKEELLQDINNRIRDVSSMRDDLEAYKTGNIDNDIDRLDEHLCRAWNGLYDAEQTLKGIHADEA